MLEQLLDLLQANAFKAALSFVTTVLAVLRWRDQRQVKSEVMSLSDKLTRNIALQYKILDAISKRPDTDIEIVNLEAASKKQGARLLAVIMRGLGGLLYYGALAAAVFFLVFGILVTI